MSGLIPFRLGWGKILSDSGPRTRQEPVEQDSRVDMTSVYYNLYSFPSFPAPSEPDTDAPIEIEVR